MAKFITNSTGTKAICKSEVVSLEITYNPSRGVEGEEPTLAYYSLDILFIGLGGHVWSFETDNTLEGIQAKGATVMQLLEAE